MVMTLRWGHWQRCQQMQRSSSRWARVERFRRSGALVLQISRLDIRICLELLIAGDDISPLSLACTLLMCHVRDAGAECLSVS